MAELYSRHRLRLQAPGQRLVFALADAVEGLTRSKARQALTAGLIRCDRAVVSDPGLVLGEAPVDILLDLSQGLRHGRPGRAAGRPFTLLYEDEQILVVDKACGVLAAPMAAGDHGHLPELLRSWLQQRGGDAGFIGVVHRIDQDTSGCVCFARNRQAQRLLGRQFHDHAAARTYRCLVLGHPHQDTDTLTGRLGRGPDGKRWLVDADRPGKDVVTHFQVERRLRLGSELSVHLETGRTHQIRIHLASIGCPVAGDPLYLHPPGRKRPRGMPRAPRLMLHAASLAFDHPRTGQRMTVEAPLPEEFASFARLLG